MKISQFVRSGKTETKIDFYISITAKKKNKYVRTEIWWGNLKQREHLEDVSACIKG